MRLRKAPRIRLDSAKAVPQVFFSAAQASVAAFILYTVTLFVSTNIVENPIQGNRIGNVSNLDVLFRVPFKLHELFVE